VATFVTTGLTDDRPPFAVWLLRPFVDLGPLARGPLYARGIEEYWQAFAEPTRPPFVLQRILPHPFRRQLTTEAGLFEYAVENPCDLPRALQTSRWRSMCEAIEAWADLDLNRQRRLVLLLHALGFYTTVSQLVPESDDRHTWSEPGRAALEYWGASARYVLGLPNRVADYADAALAPFEAVLAAAAPDDPITFNAAVKIFVHKAKTGAPLGDLVECRTRAEQAVNAVVSTSDRFTANLVTSIFYRAISFVPQQQGDRAEVVRLMDLAEQYALGTVPTTPAEELLHLENIHPVMESRTKEALWLGDHDLALQRALRVVELDPYDAKAWVEVGEVRSSRNEWMSAAESYVMAAILGPPASAIARHMAALCFRKLEQPVLASFFLNSALTVDPTAISSSEGLLDLPDSPVFDALKEWSVRTVNL
jgi:tetratricopeptide (TPR) repeat protein